MTKKRWLLATTCLASLIGVPILVIALLPPRPGVTKANFDRIQIGMSEAEVTRILGEPSEEIFGGDIVGLEPGGGVAFWHPPEVLVIASIVFNGNGRVSEKEWADRTFFGRLRRDYPWLPF